jgi:4-carboxymuconolactone decarboxylase
MPHVIIKMYPVKARRRIAALAAAILSIPLAAVPRGQAQPAPAPSAPGAAPPPREDVRLVAPALERYAQGPLMGELWRRPDLAPRDRGLVTLTALIARGQTVELRAYLNLALDHGVTPGEISETITHLAFYAGWGNAVAAIPFAREVFAARGIGPDRVPPASPALLPLDQAAEAERVARVDRLAGPVVPGLVQFTTDVLFRDLWPRPGLAPRDRSLVTVSALIAAGQMAQLPSHLNRAMDNGLTRTEAAEVVAHLAFYAGWPNAFSTIPVLREVFASRPG